MDWWPSCRVGAAGLAWPAQGEEPSPWCPCTNCTKTAPRRRACGALFGGWWGHPEICSWGMTLCYKALIFDLINLCKPVFCSRMVLGSRGNYIFSLSEKDNTDSDDGYSSQSRAQWSRDFINNVNTKRGAKSFQVCVLSQYQWEHQIPLMQGFVLLWHYIN